jgi:hypothetical protein
MGASQKMKGSENGRRDLFPLPMDSWRANSSGAAADTTNNPFEANFASEQHSNIILSL